MLDFEGAMWAPEPIVWPIEPGSGLNFRGGKASSDFGNNARAESGKHDLINQMDIRISLSLPLSVRGLHVLSMTILVLWSWAQIPWLWARINWSWAETPWFWVWLPWVKAQIPWPQAPSGTQIPWSRALGPVPALTMSFWHSGSDIAP